MNLWDFIEKYYVNSIVYKTGYNPVNEATWAILLVVIAYVLYKWLKGFVKFDERFFYGNIPFIVFASCLRVIEDAGFVKPPLEYVLMSPMIEFVVFAVALPSLLLSIRLRGERYWIHYGALGLILATITAATLLLNLRVVHWFVLPTALAIATAFTLLYHFLTKRSLRHMHNRLSELVIFAHMLDASATFLGIQFLGYWELHVIPRLLISRFGPWIMIPAKFALFILILYILDGEKDENVKNYIKFVLFAFGLGPGLRDAIRMMFGV